MKKLMVIAILAIYAQVSYSQSPTLNLSSANPGWTCLTPGVTTSNTTFYNNPWIAINNPTVTTYTFERKFWICKSDNYHFSLKGMGDNHMKVFIDNETNPVIDKDVTDASQFNTLATYEGKRDLKCGLHTLKVTIKNHGSVAGFVLNSVLYSSNGAISNQECKCEDCACNKPTDARASISINYGAGISLSASGAASVSGLGQGWVLKKVNCPLPNPCSWVAGPITFQGIGNNFNVSSGILTPGSCYILTHYVNVCSKTWNPNECRVAKTTCFTVSGNQMMAKPINSNAKISSQAIPVTSDNTPAVELSKEMLEEIKGIK